MDYEIVKKKWGHEVIIVNCPSYCAKLLCIEEGASSSIHFHIKKKETFVCLKGRVGMEFPNGVDSVLTPHSEGIPIEPGERHQFHGLTNAVILEISTHHDDDDVVRQTESTSSARVDRPLLEGRTLLGEIMGW